MFDEESEEIRKASMQGQLEDDYKIIQIIDIANSSYILALLENGSLWRRGTIDEVSHEIKWEKMPTVIDQKKRRKNAIKTYR